MKAGLPSRPRRVRVPALLLSLLMLAAAGTQAAEPVLTLHYQERPPYSSRGPDDHPQGLLIAPLVRALDQAGIVRNWVLTPGQRQLATIQSGAGHDCGIGWFRSAEREALGKFSLPIYRDRPFMALVRSDSAMRGDRSVASLLEDPALPLLVKDGYSYGAELDALIARHGRALRRTTAENAQMARMLASGRAVWMIAAPEEAEVLLGGQADTAGQLRGVALPGLGPGQQRHLYCSRAVPDALLQRIDQALGRR